MKTGPSCQGVAGPSSYHATIHLWSLGEKLTWIRLRSWSQRCAKDPWLQDLWATGVSWHRGSQVGEKNYAKFPLDSFCLLRICLCFGIGQWNRRGVICSLEFCKWSLGVPDHSSTPKAGSPTYEDQACQVSAAALTGVFTASWNPPLWGSGGFPSWMNDIATLPSLSWGLPPYSTLWTDISYGALYQVFII